MPNNLVGRTGETWISEVDEDVEEEEEEVGIVSVCRCVVARPRRVAAE